MGPERRTNISSVSEHKQSTHNDINDSMAAASSAEIEREIQQLKARLQGLRHQMAEVMERLTQHGRQRKKAVRGGRPSDVVRRNQHIRVLQRLYVTLCLQRNQVSDQLVVLKKHAQQ